jgi:predicted TPR repeat methyltransferase
VRSGAIDPRHRAPQAIDVEGAMNRSARRNPRLGLSIATELWKSARFAEAEAALRQVLGADGRGPVALRAQAFHMLGMLRRDLGDAKEGMELIARSVALVPGNAAITHNLGVVSMQAGDLARAEAAFRRVLALKPLDVPARGNLAEVLHLQGRSDESVAELRELVRLYPGDPIALAVLAKGLRMARRHEEEVVVARDLVKLRPGDEINRKALSRSYFLWLDTLDHDPEASARVLAEWLAFDPDDPVAKHMAASRAGGSDVPARASNAYVERHFDEFAPTFDQVLAGLGYRGPDLVREALEVIDPAPRPTLRVVDLGCGTGACSPVLKPWARRLVGVDLSRKMLELARARGVYDDLQAAEIAGFLEEKPGAFDLAIAADTLVYLGDLAPLFGALRGALVLGGRFIATIELDEGGDDAGYRLHVAGRYAHGAGYLRRELERAGLAVEREARAELRRERERGVPSLVVTARRV